MNKFARGSEWRKWDLHAHTPIDSDWETSVDLSTNDAKAVFAKEYVDFAIQQGLSAIAITDHNFCNTLEDCLIPYIKAKAKNTDLTIFPGFEITVKAGSGIHVLVIFHENTRYELILDIVKKCFPSGQHFDRKKVPVSNVSIDDLKKIIDEAKLDAIFIFAHIDSYNGVLNKETIYGQRRIQEWQNFNVKISQISRATNDIYWDSKEFFKGIFSNTNSDYSRKMSYILASDCRRITKDGTEDRNCLGGKFSWIKADLTFKGLREIIVEPTQRIYLGEEPPKVKDIEQNRTKYIEKIKVNADESCHDIWFNDEIPLNPGLVSIIGNKGSGKSALSDIIGLLGNCHTYEHFSFLHKDRFFKTNCADKHNAQIIWKSNKDDDVIPTVSLQSETVNNQLEKIRYIPQNYFEKICSLADEDDSFKKEIEKVIFFHIEEKDKLDAKTFRELLNKKNEANKKELEQIKSELSKTIEKYVGLEQLISTSNKKYNKSRLDEFSRQKQDIEALLKSLKAPEKNHSDESTSELSQVLTKVKTKEALLHNHQSALTEILQKEENIKMLSAELGVIKRYFDTSYKELEEKFASLNINLKDIIDFKIDKSSLEQQLKEIIKNKNTETQEVTTVQGEIDELKDKQKLEEEKLSGEQKKYQEYVNKKESLEKRQVEILGSKESPLSIKETYYYYMFLCSSEYIQQKTKEKECLFKAMQAHTKSIFEKLCETMDIYKALRKNVEKFIKEFENIESANIQVDFNTDIKIRKISKFKETIMTFIAKRGGYYGEERDKSFNENFLNTSISCIEDILCSINKFIESIKDPEENSIKGSLSNQDEKTWNGIYEYIFSLDYLDIGYELKFNNKKIEQLSPGERGLLLLVFFLLADKSNDPLVLDQPEENLDNQTIHNVLVPLIQKAKEKRQIIIVTHNANLAVVCDSEQIIYSEFKIDRTPKINYTTGAIENPDINKKLIDILEGTMPAFRVRDYKYFPDS